MEQWALLENLDQLASLVERVYLEFQEQKETLVQVVPRVALDFRVQEEKRANLVCLEKLVKWVHPERMEVMEKKEDRVFLVPLDLQDSLAQEVNLV